MRKLDVGQLAAILANVGVIASLVFVGVQVRQEAAATRAATILQLKDSWVQLNLAEATSLDLSEAFESAETKGWDGASAVEKRLVAGHFRTLFHNWSNAYYQYENGTLDENQWKAYAREAQTAARSPLIQQVWSEWNYVYDDRFRGLMNGFIAESEVDTNGQVR